MAHGPFIHFSKWEVAGRDPKARIPIIMERDFRVNLAATTFLREMYLANYALLTITHYAKILLDFFTLLQNSKIEIFQITDSDLLTWRAYLLNGRKITTRTFKAYIGVVLDFYWWSQQNGFTSLMIGKNDSEKKVFFRINAEPVTRPNGKVRLNTKLRDASTPSLPSKIRAPSNASLDAVKAAVWDAPIAWIARRNGVALEWLHESGVRRDELVNLPLSEIPKRDVLDKRVDAGKPFIVTLTRTKGDKKRDVQVTSSLMARTRNWIDFDRDKAIATKKASGVLDEDDGLVFISHKTGRGLTAQAFTNLVGIAAVRAGHPEISPHLFRHRQITELLVRKLRSGMDTEAALLQTMDHAGHARLSTTSIYLHVAQIEAENPSEAEAELAKRNEETAAGRWQKDVKRGLLKLAKNNPDLEASVNQILDLVADGVSFEAIAAAAKAVAAAPIAGGIDA